jgi:hypothetical protein
MSAAHADMFPPPIPGIDFLHLGLPLGVVVGVAATAAAVAVFRLLRRRQVHRGLAFLAATLLFGAADCASYFAGLQQASTRRRERSQERERLPEAPASASTGNQSR